MPPRLPPQGFHSFVSFSHCSRSIAIKHARQICSYRASSCSSGSSDTVLRRAEPFHSPARKRLFHASAPTRASKDPYKVLGVGKDASVSEIKKIYFSLARKYHPDTNADKSAREKFQEIQEAYDTLKDDKKRAAYDKYGAASQQPGFDADAYEQMRQDPFGAGGAGGFGGFQGFSSGFGSRPSGELFENLFDAFTGSGRQKGSNLETTIGVSFLEACRGVSRTVSTTPVANCNTCSGTGLKSGVKRSTCQSCGGAGHRTYPMANGFHMAEACKPCQGTGTTVPRGGQCGTCSGTGKVRTKKAVQVDLPAGVDNGMTFRITGAGDVSLNGGPKGDLLVHINVAPSKSFRRQGPHLYHEARIPFHRALLGGKARIPTLDGDVEVRIPPGIQQGEEMILKGRGVASAVSGPKVQGDLFVTFTVQLPRSLSDSQRKLLQEFADDVEGRPATSTTSPASDTDPDSSATTDANERPAGSTSKQESAKDDNDDQADEGNDGTDEEPERRRRRAVA